MAVTYVKNAATMLNERADSYARDAQKFRDAADINGAPILGSESDTYWASVYSVIANELRKVASEL